MNKYVLKSSQFYVHLVRQKKFLKKRKKIAITRDDYLKIVFLCVELYTSQV